MKLTYDVQDKPAWSKTIVFAFQQMIAIMAATLLVPMLVTGFGLEADPAAALFGAGIGTLVYILCTLKKSPVFLGSSFTFLGAYAASIGQNYGYWGMLIGVLFAGLVYVVIALVIKLVGSRWVNKLMPAVIIGPIVTLIGLSLSGTATGWVSGNGGDSYSLITIAVVSLLICLAQFAVGRYIGHFFGTVIESGQGLGQKNTAFAVWIAYTYLSPLSVAGPGCYILWQNAINSLEIWHHRKQQERQLKTT